MDELEALDKQLQKCVDALDRAVELLEKLTGLREVDNLEDGELKEGAD